MPPKKKRKNNAGKELPLLTVQGVLRLDKSFTKARHDDATTIVVRKNETSEPEVIKLVPGQSEHEFVQYKMGYEMGPANPNPANETEKEIMNQKAKVDAINEAFEEMKRQSELDRKMRMEKFNTEVDSEEIPTTVNLNPKELDPDNPENYFLPQSPQDVRDSPMNNLDNEDDRARTTSTSPKIVNNEQLGSEKLDLPCGEPQFGPSMALSVALEMDEKRRQEALERRELITASANNEEDAGMFSIDEIELFQKKQEMISSKQQASKKNPSILLIVEKSVTVSSIDKILTGPEPSHSEIVKAVQEQENFDAKAALESYWGFVRSNPRDFNGWTYLLHHVEMIDVLDEIRTAYNAFLPLYPYCFAYWMRYSDCEKRHGNWSRALGILHRGLEAIPVCSELWIYYLELFNKLYKNETNFGELFHQQCEKGAETLGLDFRSDAFWERYIEWELERKNLRNITAIYKKLIGIPTRLFNRHWDNFIAHVRDHHPRDILEYGEYEKLRKLTCEELQLTYRPDPVKDVSKVVQRDVHFPEDKLKAGMKERIVASMVASHERCESDVKKRSGFESKIKRTYFHTRHLDLKQLKNWEAYLDFEISEKNHDRIVILFERCLIATACYEYFWAKYARYLEIYHQNAQSDATTSLKRDELASSQLENANKSGFEKAEKANLTSWTVKGWEKRDELFQGEKTCSIGEEEKNDPHLDPVQITSCEESKVGGGAISEEKSDGREAVRDVYKRACLVHCPKRPTIKLKWSAFEEEVGNVEEAKKILDDIKKDYPLLLECWMQLADIERRAGNYTKVEEIYKQLMKSIPQNRRHIKTWLALKLSRFQFKVFNKPESALSTLRSAVKKDRGDHRLYSQIIEVCYQRPNVEVKGVAAAIELALNSPELTNLQKLDFVKRKIEFMQEFGDIKRYRDACDQLKLYRKLCSADLKAKEREKRELLKEEEKLKELKEFKAQTRANANLKAKVAEQEGRLLCTQCQVTLYPDAYGDYEFERIPTRRPVSSVCGEAKEAEQSANDVGDDDGVLDLMDMIIPEEQEEQIKKNLMEKTKYKEVAPTWELNMETYGYGNRRKTYDPDYEHVESAKFKEYERLESKGYDEELKDEGREKLKALSTPGLGSRELKKLPKSDKNHSLNDYVVPPKVPQLLPGPSGITEPSDDADKHTDHDVSVFVLPAEIADPSKNPCVNVPDWFVKSGGELCLSDTKNGMSVIRYWPKFLSDKGNSHIFNQLRKYCKWHQKQVKIGGEWKYETRLVAWYGPCNYVYSGLTLEKNLNWAPELLDLLHRLIGMTKHDFNSCFLNLYRHGNDMCGWHADVHPQLGRNPPVASVSLGATRVIEFRKKTGSPNFIRFPLLPGSLLIMEGATQEDWLHSVPRDVTVVGERINLTFRIMYSVNKR